MNAAAAAVLIQICKSPVIAITIAALVSTWVRLFHSRTDPTLYTYSYTDLLTRQQWWKLLTAPFCHVTFLALLFNSITLWGIRSIEVTYGSFFFLRYTLLLMIIEGLLTTAVVHLIVTYSSTQYPFRNISTGGCSGVIISWLAFQQMSGIGMSDPFYLFGIVPFPWELAPLLVIFITNYPVSSRTVVILNVVSLFTGHALSFGLIAILSDIYWSTCFLFNVAAYLLLGSTVFQETFAALHSSNLGNSISSQQPGSDIMEEIRTREGNNDDDDIESGRGDLDVTEGPASRGMTAVSRRSWVPASQESDSSVLSPLLSRRDAEVEEEEGSFEGRGSPFDYSQSGRGGRR